MKVGRNDPCPCGSGLKYKKCCLMKEKAFDPLEAIVRITAENGYPETLSNVLVRMYQYIKVNDWRGACHASCAVLYVALCELGYKPELCVGEADNNDFIFDHSWITLDGHIIDLAVAFTLIGVEVSNAVLFDVDIYTGKKPFLIYGTDRGRGLDADANLATTVPFCLYMDNFPEHQNGLWGVVEEILGKKLDYQELRNKYSETKWNTIR